MRSFFLFWNPASGKTSEVFTLLLRQIAQVGGCTCVTMGVFIRGFYTKLLEIRKLQGVEFSIGTRKGLPKISRCFKNSPLYVFLTICWLLLTSNLIYLLAGEQLGNYFYIQTVGIRCFDFKFCKIL